MDGQLHWLLQLPALRALPLLDVSGVAVWRLGPVIGPNSSQVLVKVQTLARASGLCLLSSWAPTPDAAQRNARVPDPACRLRSCVPAFLHALHRWVGSLYSAMVYLVEYPLLFKLESREWDRRGFLPFFM